MKFSDILSQIFYIIIATFISYVCVSFVKLEDDFTKWSEHSREGFLFLSAAMYFVVNAVVYSILKYHEEESKNN